jgi:hypothetical protein
MKFCEVRVKSLYIVWLRLYCHICSVELLLSKFDNLGHCQEIGRVDQVASRKNAIRKPMADRVSMDGGQPDWTL